MNVSSIFIMLSLLCAFSQGNIVIYIEPDELQRVAEILVQSYISQNLTPQTGLQRNIVFTYMKKFSYSTVQLVGIMFSLVGANLLTKIFEPNVLPLQSSIIDNDNNNSTSIKPSQLCKSDYGCDRNVCWRSCGKESDDTRSWCYTTPNLESRNYQQCIYSYDCSPCWECIGVCHKPNK